MPSKKNNRPGHKNLADGLKETWPQSCSLKLCRFDLELLGRNVQGMLSCLVPAWLQHDFPQRHVPKLQQVHYAIIALSDPPGFLEKPATASEPDFQN